MNETLLLASGIGAALGLAMLSVRRAFRRFQREVERDRAEAELLRAARPPMPPAPPVSRRVYEDGERVLTMVSKGRDAYGSVLESVVVRAPRYRPVCEWCRADLKTDSQGLCAGCGAKP